MKHVLASVALLGLVMGCDATGGLTTENADDAGDTTPASGGTGGTDGGGAVDGDGDGDGDGNSDSAAATVTTGVGFTAAVTGTIGTIGGGQVAGAGAFGGSGGESGSDGDDGVGGEAGAPNYPENPYPAVAMTRAQRQALWDAQSSPNGVSTTGTIETDPDELWVVIADTPLVCTEFPPFPECGGHWQVDFMLPVSMQEPGTYDLEWFGYSYADVAEDPSMPDICGGGGGSGSIDGRIVEVLELTATEIRFRLHSDPAFIDDDVNGIYTVPLCP